MHDNVGATTGCQQLKLAILANATIRSVVGPRAVLTHMMLGGRF